MSLITGPIGSSLTFAAFVAVGSGAALGAWLRWLLALGLNHLLPMLPLGTLLVNLGGGFLIGFATGYVLQHVDLAPHWRLFAITGFLGGLTTFSAFSAEAMSLLHRGEYGWALLHSDDHLIGSIVFCLAGYALYRALN